ncbi:MAG: VWA domain-containing protein [Candidatus Thorarchaeota archaeon]
MKMSELVAIIILISVIFSSFLSYMSLETSKQSLTDEFAFEAEQSLLNKNLVQAKQLNSILGKTSSVVEASAKFAEKIFSDPTIPSVPSYYHNPETNNAPPDLIYSDTYGREISLNYSAYKIAPTAFNLADQSTYLSLDPENWNPLDHVNSTIKDTILTSAKLDLIWRDLYNSFPGHVWLYMGFEYGFHRSFPWHSYSKSYDPRIRPWYVGAVTGSKDVVVILDTSGSMGGTPIANTKDAAKRVFSTLGPRDRLTVLSFSGNVKSFKDDLEIYSDVLQTEASNYVDSLSANGGTNINQALIDGLNILKNKGSEDKAPIVIFMTDGEPTSGETTKSKILSNIQSANTIGAKIFVFGLGSGIDQNFLNNIAQENNGNAVFIENSEDIAEAMSRYYQFFTSNVQSNLIWSYPYIDQSGFGIIITASKPVIVNNKFIGVISADLTLSYLIEIINNFKPSTNGYNFIFDSAGVMVVHPSIFDKEPKDWRTQDIRIPIENFETSDPVFINLKDKALAGESVAGNVLYGSNRKIIAFSSIGNTSLRLASILPDSDVAKSNYPTFFSLELWQISWLMFTGLGTGIALIAIIQTKKHLNEVK